VLGFIGGVGLAEPLVSAFAIAHPDIELVVREVSFADQVDWLLDGTVDAAVLNPGPPSPEFHTVPIASTSLCVFVSEHHRLASRTELRYADVADETYLGKAPGLPDWWVDIWWLTERRGGPPRTGRRTSGTVNESIAGVMSGEVIVVSPTFFIPPIPIPGVVATHPPTTSRRERDRGAVSWTGDLQPRSIRCNGWDRGFYVGWAGCCRPWRGSRARSPGRRSSRP